MKQKINYLLRPFYIFVLILALMIPMVLPASAADAGVYSASDYLIEMIIAHEGFVSTPMYDYGNNSVGYGFNFDYAAKVLPEVGRRGSITEEEALYVLKTMISDVFEPTLNSFLWKEQIAVNQNQYDALIDLTYNIPEWITYVNDDGTRCLLVRLLQEGPSAWTEARVREAFGKWNKAGGVPLSGLTRIRNMEADLFLDPVPRQAAGSYVSPNVPMNSNGEDLTVSSDVFYDVDVNEWYYPYVMGVYDKKIMLGHGDGTFAPETQLERAQLIQAFANFDGVDLSNYNWTSFSDVPQDEWYTPAIAWGLHQGIIPWSWNSTTFGPTDAVTREELCIYLAHFLDLYQLDPVRQPVVFQDAGQMSPAGQSAVDYCSARGVIDGTGEGTFSPKDYVDRAQLAKILLVMDELING